MDLSPSPLEEKNQQPPPLEEKNQQPPRRAKIWALAALLVYAGAALMPLLSSTGRNFEYEYTILVNLLLLLGLPLAAALLPLPRQPRAKPQKKTGHGRGVSPLFYLWPGVLAPVTLLLPGALAFWLEACPCSPRGFFFWFGLNLLPGIALAHLLALFFWRWRLGGGRRSSGLFFLLLFWLLACGFTLFWLWWFPQKRMVSLVFGFLAGPIYDHLLEIDSGMIYLRLAQLLLLWGVLALFAAARGLRLLGLVLATAGGLLTFTLSLQRSSVAHGEWALQKELPLSIDRSEEEGFRVFYRSPTSAADVSRISEQAGFHLREIAGQLGLSLPLRPRISIYVYPDGRRKKLWFGAGDRTDVTDVVGPSIHINPIAGRGELHPTLRHELVHAAAAPYGYHGLGFHPAIALTEGLAIALAPEPRRLELHAAAAYLLAQKKITDLDALFSPLFWRTAGPRAYTVAGSFLRYLLDQGGRAWVLPLYGGHQDWQELFGRTRRELLEDWKSFIAPLYQAEREELLARRLYREPSLFDDQCPHTRALLQQEDEGERWIRGWRRPLEFRPARDFPRWLERRALPGSEEQLGRRLSKLRRELRRLYRNRPQGGSSSAPPLSGSGERGQSLERIRRGLERMVSRERLGEGRGRFAPSHLEGFDAALLLSDLDGLQGHPDRAAALRVELEAFSARRELGARARALAARKTLWEMPSSDRTPLPPALATLRWSWQAYLAGIGPLPPRAKERTEAFFAKKLGGMEEEKLGALLGYLTLRRSSGELGEKTLNRMLERPLFKKALESSGLRRESYRLLAQEFYARGDRGRAEKVAKKALEHAKKGERAPLHLMQRLFAWLKKN